MLETERIKLKEAAEKADGVSLAITADGKPLLKLDVPWEMTSSAMNMTTPTVTMAVSDLKDAEIMADVERAQLHGLYIFAPLDDYEWIADFTDLWDIYITQGENIHDLLFLLNHGDLDMFYLEDADIDNLEPLVENFNEANSFLGKCIGLCNCKVEDTSALEAADFYIEELLIWPVKGDSKERWQVTPERPGVFKFYTK